MPGVGASAGEDPDADAMMVLVLFFRLDGRRALTRLIINRESLREVPSKMERKRLAQARRRFSEELCCRGLLEYQGENREPIKSCRKLNEGTCHRFVKTA